ncbi:Ig-like domain-containing protein [Lysinibacillus sp. IITD104]|uniref:Ig-like domain-containing protein n=1 Tax=Lysinibacillus sp. IITD104 TaxID=3116650 RepID=UPI002FCFB1B5
MKINSVKVDTGNAVVKAVNGNEVTLSMSGGAKKRSVWTGGTYTPADNKTVTDSRSISASWATGSDGVVIRANTGGSLPDSLSYNSSGYTGTLNRVNTVTTGEYVNAAYNAIMNPVGTKMPYVNLSYSGTQKYEYSGTVTKPATDTRTYTHYYQYVVTVDYEDNKAPTVTVTSPENNITLYENDTLNVTGTAIDQDPDQSVTVYYQIDDNPKKVLATNLSQIQISLSKQLTFKGGKLYDGETVLTEMLAEGIEHKLKVWAIDNEGAQSTTVERTFYVVPNRAPLLSVDTIIPGGIIDTDKFKIKGSAGDPDANASIKVSYRINTGNPVQIYNGPGGTWELEITLSQLAVGENTIVVEVIDNYNAKTSKTIKLNKNTVKTPILQSVARYKIEPPKGSAKGVLLFIERDADLVVKVELSMTLTGEQEQYITLTPVNTAPTNSGTVEDTFEHTVSEEKQNIILKITPSRTDLSFNHKIHLISGVVD